MPRRPATITQADVARIIRAAKKEGCAAVSVEGAKVIIYIDPQAAPEPTQPPVEPKREIVL